MNDRMTIAAMKARVDLSGLVAGVVDLKPRHGEFVGCCPFHTEKSPSFTVNDRKQFYHCFGCGAHGDHLDWLTEQGGMEQSEALRHLSALAGGEAPLPKPVQRRTGFNQGQNQNDSLAPDEEARRKKALAIKIWQEAVPIEGTPAEDYLRQARGIKCALPKGLRYHASCPDGLGRDCAVLSRGPALVAAVVHPSADGGLTVQAVHRTFLDLNGKGGIAVKRSGKRAKLMLGRVGGGFVLLSAQLSRHWHVSEGIETGLSVQDLHGDMARSGEVSEPAFMRCYVAGLSLSGFGKLLVTGRCDRVSFWVDNDTKSPREQAHREAAKFYIRTGIDPLVIFPPDNQDFNSVATQIYSQNNAVTA